MSGGVDSSVVAALLAEAGHEVVGITLQLYDHGAAVGRAGACCAGQDILDARRVADHVGIAHDVLDMEARLRSAVIEDFAEAYARGLTAHAVQRRSEHQKTPRHAQVAPSLAKPPKLTRRPWHRFAPLENRAEPPQALRPETPLRNGSDAMKAFILSALVAVALAVAGAYVLSENFQQTAESAFATSGVRL